MTKEQARKWLPEITHWVNGSNVWWYDKNAKIWYMYRGDELGFNREEKFMYVIEDKHFEARKAHALGEPIEYWNYRTEEWLEAQSNPSWGEESRYRPKKKEWYDNIPEEGVLCWCKGGRDKPYPMVIYKYEDEFFYDSDSYRWLSAVPVKPEECYEGYVNE